MRKSLCIIALAASLTAGAQTYYSENFSAGIQQIQPEGTDDKLEAPVEYFDLTGRRLSAPAGLHIERCGNRSKLIIK